MVSNSVDLPCSIEDVQLAKAKFPFCVTPSSSSSSSFMISCEDTRRVCVCSIRYCICLTGIVWTVESKCHLLRHFWDPKADTDYFDIICGILPSHNSGILHVFEKKLYRGILFLGILGYHKNWPYHIISSTECFYATDVSYTLLSSSAPDINLILNRDRSTEHSCNNSNIDNQTVSVSSSSISVSPPISSTSIPTSSYPTFCSIPTSIKS